MNRIFREKHTDNFTVLPNAIFKSGLSLKAIGLLTYILHLPNDWVIIKTQLYKSLDKDGRQSIEGAWKELVDAGFIKIDKQVGQNGNLPIINYYIYDCPKKDADSQHAGFQHADSTQRKTSVLKTSVRKTGVLLSTKEQRTNQLSTKEQSFVPVGTVDPSPTVNLDLEKAVKEPADRLPIPDYSAEIKKEHKVYETEVLPALREMTPIDKKRKIAEYIQEKKPGFFEPYKDLWNLSAPANGLKKIEKISDGRLKQFKTRIKDPDFDFIRVMMEIKKSRVLKGDNNTGWKVTWEFIFKNDTNYLKIIEGQYE